MCFFFFASFAIRSNLSSFVTGSSLWAESALSVVAFLSVSCLGRLPPIVLGPFPVLVECSLLLSRSCEVASSLSCSGPSGLSSPHLSSLVSSSLLFFFFFFSPRSPSRSISSNALSFFLRLVFSQASSPSSSSSLSSGSSSAPRAHSIRGIAPSASFLCIIRSSVSLGPPFRSLPLSFLFFFFFFFFFSAFNSPLALV